MTKLRIATLHCFGSNPAKHATQRHHFKHCAEATRGLAEWLYPKGPNTMAPEIIQSLLKHDMGCSDEEVAEFGFEDPRCWFRFTDGAYAGLEASMEYLADFCRRERPDGIAGYSNGGGAALLVAAAREAGEEAFQSIRFLMSFAGPTSPTMQSHIRAAVGANGRITIPSIIFGSTRDPMLANADQMARDLFEHCTLAVTDEARPFANHALPDDAESYAPVVAFLEGQAAT
ncbi:MAG: hypothetical protein ABL883_12635 [Terricaulis sp.]